MLSLLICPAVIHLHRTSERGELCGRQIGKIRRYRAQLVVANIGFMTPSVKVMPTRCCRNKGDLRVLATATIVVIG